MPAFCSPQPQDHPPHGFDAPVASGKVLQKLPTLATATKNREDDGKKCAARLNGPVHFYVNLPSAQTLVLHLGVGAPGRRLSPNRQRLQAKGQRGRRGRRLSATCQGFLLERQRKGSASTTRKVHQHRCIKAARVFFLGGSTFSFIF